MAQNPNPSQLDPGQIVKRAFDDANDRIRVETDATVIAGAMEVAIDATADSIKIGNTATGPFLNVNADGSINVTISQAANSSVTRVNSSASNVTLLAINTARKAATFYNESTATAYIKLGATASVTSYTLQMQPNSFYILNFDPIYTGRIDAIWSAANGAMQVTELS